MVEKVEAGLGGLTEKLKDLVIPSSAARSGVEAPDVPPKSPRRVASFKKDGGVGDSGGG